VVLMAVSTKDKEDLEMSKQEKTSGEPTLINETYVCSCADGMVEWGFCFKQDDGDDIEFDLVIDKATSDIGTPERIEADYARLQWVADAITEASKKHSYSRRS
jgi:hypothetical protein